MMDEVDNPESSPTQPSIRIVNEDDEDMGPARRVVELPIRRRSVRMQNWKHTRFDVYGGDEGVVIDADPLHREDVEALIQTLNEALAGMR